MLLLIKEKEVRQTYHGGSELVVGRAIRRLPRRARECATYLNCRFDGQSNSPIWRQRREILKCTQLVANEAVKQNTSPLASKPVKVRQTTYADRHFDRKQAFWPSRGRALGWTAGCGMVDFYRYAEF